MEDLASAILKLLLRPPFLVGVYLQVLDTDNASHFGTLRDIAQEDQ